MVLSNGLVSPISSDCSFPSSSFKVAAMRGGSNPYCFGYPSPTSLFCRRSATAVTIASICVASASASIGSTSFHDVLSSGRVALAKTLPSFATRISRTLARSRSPTTLAAFSFFVSSLLTSFCTQKAAPAIAAATTRKPRVVRSDLLVCFMNGGAGFARDGRRPKAGAWGVLSALAGLPHEEAREQEAEGKHVERHQRHGVLLLGGEEEVIRLPAARPDGDLRLLVRGPADRVHRQVAVPGEPVEAVRREIRVAEDDHARLVVPEAVRRRDGEGHRTLQVLARRVLHLAVVLDGVGLAPGAGARPGQLHHRPARRRRFRLRDAAREGEDAGEREGGVARRRDGMVGVVLRDGDLRLLRLGVDDLVVSNLGADGREHLLEPAVHARVDQDHELAGLPGPVLDELRLALAQGGDRSGDDERLHVPGHLLVGGELDLV